MGSEKVKKEDLRNFTWGGQRNQWELEESSSSDQEKVFEGKF